MGCSVSACVCLRLQSFCGENGVVVDNLLRPRLSRDKPISEGQQRSTGRREAPTLMLERGNV